MKWKLQKWLTKSSQSELISISPPVILFIFFFGDCQNCQLFRLIFCYILPTSYFYFSILRGNWVKKSVSSPFHLLFSYLTIFGNTYFIQKQSSSNNRRYESYMQFPSLCDINVWNCNIYFLDVLKEKLVS